MSPLIFKLAQKARSPKQIQQALREMPYNRELNGETLRSAHGALKAKTAHCFEAVFIAAAVMEFHGYPPLLLSLESKDNLDHVVYLFRQNNRWGTVGRSRDAGLHGRAPVFKTLEQLAWSYYAPYIDKTGEITGFQVVHLDEMTADWRGSKNNVWSAEQYLIDLKHERLRAPRQRYHKFHKRYLSEGPLLTGKYWW